MADFSANEIYRLDKMRSFRRKHPGSAYWNVIGDKGAEFQNRELMTQWDNFTKYGQRVGKPKPPETWLTKRRGYMRKRYTKTPEGGFSGALGGAAIQKKKLLGA